MLVLSRRIGEMLKVGDDVEIHILDIGRGQVRIGIDAPRSVNIVRSELLDRPAPERAVDTSINPPAKNTRGSGFLRSASRGNTGIKEN
ncbi:MAG: carbon storage regulator [Spongiibacteraceae bacterium]